ncbi:MAG: hypothetical protein B6245_18360 [Desulfobacteraceae bacterium 4572_88]|nr:MAG: hypothetical protein B6245_18360 [Desulfobacteraceae bacterium 4572_88]
MEIKDKQQLVDEVDALLRKVAELEDSVARHKQERETYHTAFEYAKNAILWIDTERGMIVNCNKSAETLLEKTRDEIVGHLKLTIHPPGKAEYYVRVFKIQTDKRYGFAYDASQGFAYEAEIITKSGKIIPVQITASVTTVDGREIIQELFHDIGKHKNAEKRLKEARTTVEQMLEAIPYPVFYKDTDGTYRGCNAAFSEFSGVSKKEIIGRTDADIFPKAIVAEFQKKEAAVFSGASSKSDKESVRFSDGRVILLETFRTPCHLPEGEVGGLVGLYQDVTGKEKHLGSQQKSNTENRRFQTEAFQKATQNLMVAQNQLKLKNTRLNETLAEVEQANKKIVLAQQEVELKNAKLNKMLKEVEEANEKIMDSIRYAKLIQTSLLPNLDGGKIYLPNSFVIWMPKDVVGGDIFFKDNFESGFVLAVIDCTGHGVPGAFMTMIASSGLRRIIKDEGCRDPAQILKQLNFIVKTSLQQDKEDALSDDGLDAAICFVSDLSWPGDANPYFFALTFAGARLPLFYAHEDEVHVIKGDKQSLGYKKSDLNFNFTNHTVKLEKGMSFYMATDGFVDQLGGKRERRFGSKRFKELLRKNASLPFEGQRDLMLQAFEEHRGDYEQQDDVTVVGFGF